MGQGDAGSDWQNFRSRARRRRYSYIRTHLPHSDAWDAVLEHSEILQNGEHGQTSPRCRIIYRARPKTIPDSRDYVKLGHCWRGQLARPEKRRGRTKWQDFRRTLADNGGCLGACRQSLATVERIDRLFVSAQRTASAHVAARSAAEAILAPQSANICAVAATSSALDAAMLPFGKTRLFSKPIRT